MRSSTIISLTVLLAGSFAPIALSRDHVVKNRPMSPHGVVAVENIAGSIDVVGWDRDELEVTGDLGRGTEGLEISGDGDNITISVDVMDNLNDIEGSDLRIRVPRGVRLEIGTVSASITIADLNGDLDLESVSGNIVVRGQPGRMDLQDISGRIEVTLQGPLEEGDFQTVAGTIIVNADLAPDARLELESVSGDIELRLPGNVSAQVELSTFSGTIENEFGTQPHKPSDLLPTKELRFTLGDGDARVAAQTVSGDIAIRKR